MTYPGTSKKSFYLKFDSVDWIKRKDIITVTNKGGFFKVLKVYKLNWWRKLLLRLGFRIKILQVKVISND
jgi:hypothetical protein